MINMQDDKAVKINNFHALSSFLFVHASTQFIIDIAQPVSNEDVYTVTLHTTPLSEGGRTIQVSKKAWDEEAAIKMADIMLKQTGFIPEHYSIINGFAWAMVVNEAAYHILNKYSEVNSAYRAAYDCSNGYSIEEFTLEFDNDTMRDMSIIHSLNTYIHSGNFDGKPVTIKLLVHKDHEGEVKLYVRDANSDFMTYNKIDGLASQYYSACYALQINTDGDLDDAKMFWLYYDSNNVAHRRPIEIIDIDYGEDDNGITFKLEDDVTIPLDHFLNFSRY